MQVKSYHKLVQRCQLRSEEDWRCQQAGQQEYYRQEQDGAQGPHLRQSNMRIGILKTLKRIQNIFSFSKIKRVFYSKEIKYEKDLLVSLMLLLKGMPCHSTWSNKRVYLHNYQASSEFINIGYTGQTLFAFYHICIIIFVIWMQIISTISVSFKIQ